MTAQRAKSVPPVMDRPVPYDYESCMTMATWREDLAWPLAPTVTASLFRNLLLAGIDAVQGMDGEARSIGLAVLPYAACAAMVAGEAAMCVEAEASTGLRVVSAAAEFAYLRAETDVLPPGRLSTLSRHAKPKIPVLRNSLVTRRWCSDWRLPSTMLAPQAVAIAENELLAAEARRSPRRVAFRHAGAILLGTRGRQTPQRTASSTATVEALLQAFVSATSLHSDIAERLASLLRAAIAPLAEIAQAELAALAASLRLPDELWAGTAGNFASRLLGISVHERGGKVVRFDHGGTVGMTVQPEALVATELWPVSQYVFPTPALADNVRTSGVGRLLPKSAKPELVGAAGDPVFAVPPLPRATGSRRRVVYCPSLLFGFRRHSHATVSDAIALDWNLRVAEALARLDIDLLCKPHPEGILRGQPHPIEAISATSYRPFEEEMAAAAVFVFDRVASTAFWKALCTDRPVVVLQHTPPDLHPNVEAAMRARCTFVKVSFDDRNRPQFDRREMEQAVRDAPRSVDCTAVRALLAG